MPEGNSVFQNLMTVLKKTDPVAILDQLMGLAPAPVNPPGARPPSGSKARGEKIGIFTSRPPKSAFGRGVIGEMRKSSTDFWGAVSKHFPRAIKPLQGFDKGKVFTAQNARDLHHHIATRTIPARSDGRRLYADVDFVTGYQDTRTGEFIRDLPSPKLEKRWEEINDAWDALTPEFKR